MSDLWRGACHRLSRFAGARASRLEAGDPSAARRWLRLAARFSTEFGAVHRALYASYIKNNDRLGAAAVAQTMVDRFNDSADAWMLVGEANMGAYRLHD